MCHVCDVMAAQWMQRIVVTSDEQQQQIPVTNLEALLNNGVDNGQHLFLEVCY